MGLFSVRRAETTGRGSCIKDVRCLSKILKEIYIYCMWHFYSNYQCTLFSRKVKFDTGELRAISLKHENVICSLCIITLKM